MTSLQQLQLFENFVFVLLVNDPGKYKIIRHGVFLWSIIFECSIFIENYYPFNVPCIAINSICYSVHR